MIARPVRNGDDIDNDTRQGQCHAAGAVGNDSAEHRDRTVGDRLVSPDTRDGNHEPMNKTRTAQWYTPVFWSRTNSDRP